MKKNKGFTLLEVLIVVVILGVLAGLAIPRFINASAAAREAEAFAQISALKGGIIRYLGQAQPGVDLTVTEADIAFLDVDNPNDDALFQNSSWDYAFDVTRVAADGTIEGTIDATSEDAIFNGSTRTITLTVETGAIVRVDA